MMKKTGHSRTLGRISAYLLDELMDDGKSIFTLEEAASILSDDQANVSNLLGKLVKQGTLARIKYGVYLILLAGQESAQLSNWPIIARILAGKKDYYLSHYSAMRLHGMTTHTFNEVYITVTSQQRTKAVNDITYRFIYSKPKYFWGYKTHWVNRYEKVVVSDLERTIIDGLERPDLCGGIEEVIIGIWVKQHDFNWDQLIEYCKNSRTMATIKRLGFILEMLTIQNSVIENLRHLTAKASDYILFDPQGEKTGNYLNRWHLRVNVNIDELKHRVLR